MLDVTFELSEEKINSCFNKDVQLMIEKFQFSFFTVIMNYDCRQAYFPKPIRTRLKIK